MKHLVTPFRILLHLVLAYLVFMLARIVYLFENWQTLNGAIQGQAIWRTLTGCWYFDTSAILYTHALVVLLLVMLPTRWARRTVPWVFTLINALCLSMNLGDAVYFKYTGRRTTLSVLGEFQHDNNLLQIIGAEVVSHWYLFVLAISLIAGLFYASRWVMRCGSEPARRIPLLVQRIVSLLVFVPFCIAGMRGGWTAATRPIAVSNAAQFVQHPTEASLVLNTPFVILRTFDTEVFTDPGYFTDEQLAAIYSPVHQSADSIQVQRPMNVVVLIVESFGREYIGQYNEHLENGNYQGYAPFVDSLYHQSLSFDYTFANGRQSIDGMPSILSGIPRFMMPFFITPAAMNDVSGLAGELGKVGYTSAFFHGAQNGSMGFEAFARASGFQQYYGRTEFNQDSRFRGDEEFDGTWAIWDEPFLQFYALKMSEMSEPFVTTVFTASSHHPYVVPEQYRETYLDDDAPSVQGYNHNPIHKCIRYTDMALRRFFQTASQQPWYDHTLFVFTSDHTNIYDHPEYGTDLGLFGAPLLFFDPSGQMPSGRSHSIAQQTDILPTVLGWLGYQQPFVAWGQNLLSTPAEDTWAVNQTGSGIYQFVKGDYLLQFDGTDLTAIYRFRTDWMLQHNLLPQLQHDAVVQQYEQQLKAIIQSYMQRMVGNGLVVNNGSFS